VGASGEGGPHELCWRPLSWRPLGEPDLEAVAGLARDCLAADGG
jgi:hypothetical protein